ncbi:MAG: acyl-CoA dehydrogenase family protein [Bdellovibrionales bacterium]|nr:acyl-CoA dehydrogenase family protein [Bdellovibrionales bacterium]
MEHTEFFQDGPRLSNQYESDRILRQFLAWRLPREVSEEIEPDLRRFGARVVGEMAELADRCELHPPVMRNFDPWGRRIDEVVLDPAWGRLQDIAAEEGVVATAYERKHGAHSRLVQFAKLYLYSPSSAIFSCPLAMTDGAARALELYGDESLRRGPFRHLTSRNPKEFWTSGQWMTEKSGGSDVSGTATVAKPLGGGQFALTGSKWFTSATTAPMAMTLARIEGAAEGSRGLSLFYLELRDESGLLNGVEVHRLKDKLGTRALPTAELSLRGTRARLVGGEGHGVRKIASLFNITRVYNSVCAMANARRSLALAHDYSHRRRAFGRALTELPLHAETLADLWVEFEGNFLLTFHLGGLLGRDETGQAAPGESALLRMLTPVAKLYTGKSAMAITSECVEIFGGAGYCEDTGLPRLLREAQVFPIWEGTTNVLCLDMLRAMEKEGAFPPFLKDVTGRLGRVTDDALAPGAAKVREALAALRGFAEEAAGQGGEYMQASARRFAYSVARVYAASLFLEFAQHLGTDVARERARRWIARGLSGFLHPEESHRGLTRRILEEEPRA